MRLILHAVLWRLDSACMSVRYYNNSQHYQNTINILSAFCIERHALFLFQHGDAHAQAGEEAARACAKPVPVPTAHKTAPSLEGASL